MNPKEKYRYNPLEFKAGMLLDIGSFGSYGGLTANLYNNYTNSLATFIGVDFKYNFYDFKLPYSNEQVAITTRTKADLLLKVGARFKINKNFSISPYAIVGAGFGAFRQETTNKIIDAENGVLFTKNVYQRTRIAETTVTNTKYQYSDGRTSAIENYSPEFGSDDYKAFKELGVTPRLYLDTDGQTKVSFFEKPDFTKENAFTDFLSNLSYVDAKITTSTEDGAEIVTNNRWYFSNNLASYDGNSYTATNGGLVILNQTGVANDQQTNTYKAFIVDNYSYEEFLQKFNDSTEFSENYEGLKGILADYDLFSVDNKQNTDYKDVVQLFINESGTTGVEISDLNTPGTIQNQISNVSLNIKKESNNSGNISGYDNFQEISFWEDNDFADKVGKISESLDNYNNNLYKDERSTLKDTEESKRLTISNNNVEKVKETDFVQSVVDSTNTTITSEKYINNKQKFFFKGGLGLEFTIKNRFFIKLEYKYSSVSALRTTSSITTRGVFKYLINIYNQDYETTETIKRTGTYDIKRNAQEFTHNIDANASMNDFKAVQGIVSADMTKPSYADDGSTTTSTFNESEDSYSKIDTQTYTKSNLKDTSISVEHHKTSMGIHEFSIGFGFYFL